MQFKQACWTKHTRQWVAQLRHGIFVLHKHGYILLISPDFEPVLDITIYKAISTNPGPEDDRKSEKHLLKCAVHNGRQQDQCFGSAKHITYARSTLLPIRKQHCFDRQVLKDLREHQLLHYRGKRAGRRTSKQNTPVVITSRFNVQIHSRVPHGQVGVLIPVTRYASLNRQMDERYTVRKFLFINICSFLKTKNRIRSFMALEMDLHTNDIDICVVSETHLRPDVPDAVIAMSEQRSTTETETGVEGIVYEMNHI